MELIRLFYDSLDVKPVALLNHFLSYLGFYVEEITETTKPSKINSIADIYIISNNYMKQQQNNLVTGLNGKTILICKDGWKVDTKSIHSIQFAESSEQDEDFLFTLVSHLMSIPSYCKLLIHTPLDLNSVLKCVVKAYCKFRILPSMLYTYEFYKQPELYKIAFNNYRSFIGTLDSLQAEDRNSDFVVFVRTYAKFEFDFICKKNSRTFCYPVEELSTACQRLLSRYPENEKIRLLQADILFELEDRWAWAGNQYGDTHLFYCACAQYKRGRISRQYAQDYKSATALQKHAIRCKNNYVAAWYQLALCFEAEGRSKEEVDALEKICEILNKKYQEHLLSPIELEYLYCTVLRIAQINKTYLGNWSAASEYEKAANALKRESNSVKYLQLFWSDISTDLSNTICNVIKEKFE